MNNEIPRRTVLAAAGAFLFLGVEACGSGGDVTNADISRQMQAWKPTLTELQKAKPQNAEIVSINNHHGKKVSYALNNGELVLLTYSYKENPDSMFDDYSFTIEKGPQSWAVEIVKSPHNKPNTTWSRELYSTAKDQNHLSKSGFSDVVKNGNSFFRSLR